jgi:N-acetylmuramic acid 6-phosphate etherase
LARGFTKADVLVGIAASGQTPYTVGAVRYARDLGAFTVAVTCAPHSPITAAAEVSIVAVVGPEALAGSTRLKAGTAQKIILNMLSTATLVKLGYVTGNRMTNLSPRNAKLRARALRIIVAETGTDEATAHAAFEQAGGDQRVAILMITTSSSAAAARTALDSSGGTIAEATRILRSS